MKTVVCGIGNRMRGDDASGPMVIDELKRMVISEDVLLLDCEHFPENFIKRILDFRPERIILIDTADFGGSPGDFRKIDLDSVRKQTISTHKMPLTMLVDFIRSRIDVETIFLGIQPKNTGFGEPLSGECETAVDRVSRRIREIIR